jgi:uncharacterized protein
MYFDRTFTLLIPALLLSMYAQWKISSTFKRYSFVHNMKGYTGADVARTILNSNGLYDVQIEVVNGHLTDHYDPRTRVVRLSQEIYYGTSVASIGVASHEVGHAIQHATNYYPLSFRNAIVPIANLGSNASWILFAAGMFFGGRGLGYMLIQLGILLFIGAVVFQLATLPVEFNASSRALRILRDRNILVGDELNGAKKVLTSAAMTYVAAAAMAVSQLLRLILIFQRRDD